MYTMTCIRPDIAFSVGKLSRYTSNPGTQHWQSIQRVLKYLKKTMDYRLTYTGYPSVLEDYTDASSISNTEDNLSTSGWVFLLGGGAISWASKKQTCITGSTMESKFVALAAAGKEVEWLKNLLLEIPLWSKPIAPISIRYDSAATLAKAYSQKVIGCLMCAITCTRPDIAFAVGKLSRYTSNPRTQHWQIIQRGTEASKKQTCITSSTMESEFVALTVAGKEAKCAATLVKAYSQMYNGVSRHLGVRHSMIHELITNGVLSIEFVRSQQNLADHLTKGLARDLVIKSAEGMGLKSN
ncbi:hypothetical protein Tco_1284689 [Tanacetum coccineum]